MFKSALSLLTQQDCVEYPERGEYIKNQRIVLEVIITIEGKLPASRGLSPSFIR